MVGKIEDKQKTEIENARAIMGKNFFGVEHASELFGFDPTSKEYEGLSIYEIPYSEEMLERHKDTHFLIFITPISINNLRSIYPNFFRRSDNFHRSSFAKKEGDLGWYLIERKPKESLFGKKLEEQLSLLSVNEEIVKSQSLVYFLIANFLLNNECLLFNSTARCLDFSVLDFRVCVGKFDINLGGIEISSFWDTASLAHLSVITFLKEDK